MTDRELYIAAYTAYVLNPDQFLPGFDDWIYDNLHFYRAFEEEALKVARTGKRRYAARTIIEYLRHWTSMQEVSNSSFKINDHWTSSTARLFSILNPLYPDFFEFRKGHE